jgi:hypothetical protein
LTAFENAGYSGGEGEFGMIRPIAVLFHRSGWNCTTPVPRVQRGVDIIAECSEGTTRDCHCSGSAVSSIRPGEVLGWFGASAQETGNEKWSQQDRGPSHGLDRSAAR